MVDKIETRKSYGERSPHRRKPKQTNEIQSNASSNLRNLMAIIKSIPSVRIIGGVKIQTSEIALVSEPTYRVNGEACIVVRGVEDSVLTLDSTKSDHVVVKSMTRLLVVPDVGLVDEEYEEVELDRFACVEFRFVRGNWYILSSDGLKQS